jgi:hypothetical protein
MVLAHIAPTTACHAIGTHPASCGRTACLKMRQPPVLGGETACLKTRQPPALFQGTMRRPPASSSVTSCRRCGCHKRSLAQTSCFKQRHVLLQSQGMAYLWERGLLSELEDHTIGFPRVLALRTPTACRAVVPQLVRGLATVCLLRRGNRLSFPSLPLDSSHLPLASPFWGGRIEPAPAHAGASGDLLKGDRHS